ILQIKKLLKKYKGTELEADLLMRLAEMYLRRAKTDRFLELHRNSEEFVSVLPKIVKSVASRRHVLTAIDLFDQIERRFQKFDKLDVVIFNNAFANQQIGNVIKAEKKFLRITRDFVNSQLLPDSHLALGEIEFGRHDFKKALAHFAAVRKYPDSLAYPYGIYKSGWTQYNLQNAKAGIKDLEDVIQYGRFVKQQGIDARLDLRKEALFDMALFYEDTFLAKDAYKYFESQAGELDASPVIIRLSELYKRHARNQDTKIILTDLINRMPTSNFVPIAYVELMDASEKLKKRNDVVQLLENFDNVCATNGVWVRAQVPDVAASKDSPLSQFNENSDKQVSPAQICRKIFDKMSLGYANKWLKLWQQDNSQVVLAQSAENAFAIYLKSDGVSAESSKARFVYAELLFKRNKFREASEQYAITGQQTKDIKIGHDSRYYALISLEKAVNDKWSDKDESLFRSLAKEYLTKNKDGKYRLDIEFKVAFIAYEKGRFDEAEPQFLYLGQKYPGEDRGIKAQDLYLDILNIKKEYTKLRDYSLKLKGLASGGRIEKLTKLYEESYFSVVENLIQKEDLQGAINQYTSFANNNSKSKLAQKALWNVMQLRFKANELMSGAASAVAYYLRYPDGKDGLDALMKAAQTYESMAQLYDAANTLTKLAKADKENKIKWLQLAADFYVLSNAYKAARPLYDELSRDADTNIAFHALEQQTMIAKNENDKKLYELLLMKIAESGHQPQASLAAIHFIDSAYENKKYDEAFSLAKKLLGQEKHGAAKTALAKARLIQARILLNELKSQSVKAKLERIQTVLTLKTEKLSKAQMAYQSAAEFGDPLVTVQAYRELADCYLHYSEALRLIPVPMGLPQEEIQIFQDEMSKLSIPMEEKGIETKLRAFNLAQDFGLGENIVSELQNEIKKLNQPVTINNKNIKLQPATLVLPRSEGVGA
ncbi:MAG: hypothetical protein A2Z20_11580, partial [Bdellovibrionales bacterium RBG_16_40_8]